MKMPQRTLPMLKCEHNFARHNFARHNFASHIVAKYAVAIGVAMLAVASVATPHTTSAADALDLLGGFDRDRIAKTYPPSDSAAVGELAKLVFRLQKVDPKVLASRVRKDPTESNAAELVAAELGDAVSINGVVRSIQVIDVPGDLVEFLEFKRMRSLQIESPKQTVQVVTANVADNIAVGDQARGTGVIVQANGQVAAAAGRLSWVPSTTPSAGWMLLAKAGVDISSIVEVASRDRKPLLAADADAFYATLAAAASISGQRDLPASRNVTAVKMLTDAKTMAGHWIRFEAETVLVTRIAITDPDRQTELGMDRYFQIDAVVDLGNAVIQIEGSSDENDARFENRYPVSIVATELPAFLNEAIWKQTGVDAIVAKISRNVAIEGFFFRLWSYQTDYMNQFGGEDQFGPLVVAANITDRTPTSADPIGVSMIGWIAAVVVLAGMLATWLWHRSTTAGDREVAKKRKQASVDVDF
ncbi:hypothetical protein Poly51_18830 [Rubripirellula tenax]|uniref:Uncharacterized protein n=1 Tax=Rubripirellula tenax TaxID=2528015 RepID=A0A5C6FEF5_9BACT|nr:hypothetical protein [Rubripirellula tenax]TWU59097.1 hypothetical protein Poly51_18830 [Rubripirellula tenax]